MRRLVITLLVTTLAAMPAAAVSPSPADLLRYLPAGAEVVVGMDVAALRAHPLVQQWLLDHPVSWSGGDSDAREFLRDAGLDPLNDVDSLVVGMTPRAGGDHGLVAVGGRFDPASLAAALAGRGAVPNTIATVTVYRLPQKEGRPEPPPVVYLTDDVVVVGDIETLSAVLAGGATGNEMVRRETAADRLDVRRTFWMVATVPHQVRESVADAAATRVGEEDQALHGVLSAARTVQRVTMHVSLGDELAASGSAVADTEENAELLRDAVKGALAVARLHAQDTTPELVEILRDVKVSVEGREVRGHAAVPIAFIEKLARERHPPCEKPKVI